MPSQLAVGKNRFSWSTLNGAEQPYSNGRLTALVDEWYENYAGLDLIANKMLSGRRPRFPKSDWDLEVLLDLFTDNHVNNRLWLRQQYGVFSEMCQEDGAKAVHHYTSLFTSVMFEVGLIGIKNLPGEIDLYPGPYRPILSPEEISDQSEIVIRPMFYNALRTVV